MEKDFDQGVPSAIKVAIIGNSNSIMNSSYAALLRQDRRFIVENFSIGGSPNIVILETILSVDNLDYDFIIIETSVVDALQGPSGSYPPETALRNLRLGLECLKSASSAIILLLLLPTRIGLLEPETQTTEAIYSKVAQEFDIQMLNFFQLFREWLGNYTADRIQRLSAWAPIVAEAFDIPRTAIYDLSWSALRLKKNPANAFAIAGFLDHAHVTIAVHRLAFEILVTWMCRSPLSSSSATSKPSRTKAIRVMPSQFADRVVTRESSLMTRSLAQLKDGETVSYKCPEDYLAAGLLVNRSQTCAFVEMVSPEGSIVLDCRLLPYHAPWIALLVPIIDSVGGGEITLTARSQAPSGLLCRKLPDTGHFDATGTLEVGEMLLLNRHCDSVSKSVCDDADFGAVACDIGQAPWAKDLCLHAHQMVGGVADGLPEMFFSLTKGLETLLLDSLNGGEFDSDLRGRARMLLLMGQSREALTLLRNNMPDREPEPNLVDMERKLTSYLANLDS